MSDAENQDPSSLHVGGWVPESEAEPTSSPLDAVTELLPAIRDTKPPVQTTPAREPSAGRSVQLSQDLVIVGGIWSAEPHEHGTSTRRSPGRMLVGVLAALLGLGAVIAVPLTVGSAPPPRDSSAWEFEPGPAPVIEETAALLATTAAAPPRSTTVTRATATPSPTPAGLVGPATPTPSAGPSPTPGPAFAPLTLQAESAVLRGSATPARPSCAPSAQVVRLVGDWTSTWPDNDGTVTFTGLNLAAGGYTLTVHYVMTSDVSRDAQIRFIGSTTTTIRENFPAASCMTSKALQVTVPAGTTAIEFGNSTGRAPSIDKIVLSR